MGDNPAAEVEDYPRIRKQTRVEKSKGTKTEVQFSRSSKTHEARPQFPQVCMAGSVLNSSPGSNRNSSPGSCLASFSVHQVFEVHPRDRDPDCDRDRSGSV